MPAKSAHATRSDRSNQRGSTSERSPSNLTTRTETTPQRANKENRADQVDQFSEELSGPGARSSIHDTAPVTESKMATPHEPTIQQLKTVPVLASLFEEIGPLSDGLTINSKIGENQSTLLHVAVQKNDLEAVYYLLKYGADTNAVDKDAKSALHYAVARPNFDATVLLVEHGADINLQDSSGTSVIDYVRNTKQQLDLEYKSVRGLRSQNTRRFNVTKKMLPFLNLQSNQPGTPITTSQGSYVRPLGVNRLDRIKIPTLAVIETQQDQEAVTQGPELDIHEIDGSSGGTDKVATQRSPETPIHAEIEACINAYANMGDFFKNAELVGFDLTKGVNQPLTGFDDGNLLQLACTTEDIKAVKVLLRFGANINHVNTNHESVLDLAVSTANVQLVNDLLSTSLIVPISTENLQQTLGLLDTKIVEEPDSKAILTNERVSKCQAF